MSVSLSPSLSSCYHLNGRPKCCMMLDKVNKRCGFNPQYQILLEHSMIT